MTLARTSLWVVISAFAFGLIYRLFPLAAGPAAMAEFFITEDGYLMLTVARNLAIGNGLSVSDGTIGTNGVQPLATLLYALPYLATGGAKTASLAGVLILMTGLSVAAVFAIRSFAAGVLEDTAGMTWSDGIWPWIVAALWFVGPLFLLHSMNALETGLYTAVVAATLSYFGWVSAQGGLYTRRQQLVLGCLCGLAFLARIDGAFLVTAIFAVRFVQIQASGQASFRQAVAEAFPPGLISLAIAAPWLLHNQIFFGSIMPISGPAQSLNAAFGANLDLVPVKLFEGMFPMLPVPFGLEDIPAVQTGIAVVAAVIFVVFLWRLSATGNRFRQAVWAYALFGGFLVAYYGAFFGAPHFLSRYLAPLSPLLITAAVYVLLEVTARWSVLHWLAGTAGIAGLILSVALLGRLLLPGVKEQGHFHVVDWVQENVSETTWVGAVQTGTLGYWHDRTINLDGKVNPAALEARRREGDVLGYVSESEIDVIADWVGVTGWVDRGNAAFDAAFEVVVDDPASNLGILRRHGAGTGTGQ